MCKVYTGYHGTSEIEHGWCACTVDSPLAKARGLSLRTGAQAMLYLSLSIGHGIPFYPTGQDHKTKKSDIFAQCYPSQPITTKFQKHCLYFLNLQKQCQNISISEYYAKFLGCCIPCTDARRPVLRPWSNYSLSSLIGVFTVCHSICFIYTSYCNKKPKCSIFRIFSILISGVPILREVST